jgi:hypothetical protein
MGMKVLIMLAIIAAAELAAYWSGQRKGGRHALS